MPWYINLASLIGLSRPNIYSTFAHTTLIHIHIYSGAGGQDGRAIGAPKLTPHQTQRTRLRLAVLVQVSLLIWPQAQGFQMPPSHLGEGTMGGRWAKGCLCLRVAFQLARLAARPENRGFAKTFPSHIDQEEGKEASSISKMGLNGLSWRSSAAVWGFLG